MDERIVGLAVFAVVGVLVIRIVKRTWMSRNVTSIAGFTATLAAVPDLPSPKKITVVSKNSMLKDFLNVSLNGEVVGQVNAATSCTFSVTKQKNVVSIPGGKKSTCFFEVADMNGEGELHIKMGLTDPILVIKEGTGLKKMSF